MFIKLIDVGTMICWTKSFVYLFQLYSLLRDFSGFDEFVLHSVMPC